MSGFVGLAGKSAETLMLSDCISGDVHARQDALRAAVASAATGVPEAALRASDERWREALDAILAIPVGRMFEAACLKVSMQAPTPNLSADGAGEVPLAPFAVQSSHHPTIVATYGAIVVTLKFDVELSLEVAGAVLHARNGLFVNASTGSARGIARLSFLNANPPVEFGSPTFDLPGEIRFAKPAPISGHPA